MKCWARSEAGIKISGKNSNNLRYADDTTLMAESEEALKSLLMMVKEESEKSGLKFHIQKVRSWQLVPLLHGRDWEKVGKMTDFILGGSKTTADGDEIKRCLPLGRKPMTNLDSIL